MDAPASRALRAAASQASPRLAALLDLTARWPELREVHAATRSSDRSYRLRHAASALAACARAEMTAALLAQRSRNNLTPAAEDVGLAVVVLCGAARHSALLELLDGGLDVLAGAWHMGPAALHVVRSRLLSVIAPPAVFGRASLPVQLHLDGDGVPFACPLTALLFGSALEAGWPWHLALRLFSGLRRGVACGGGHGFIPERGKLPDPGSSWLASTLSSSAEPGVSVTLFFDEHDIVFISCTRAVFGDPALLRGPVPPWLRQSRSRWLPPFIRLELDAFGIPICPTHRVTALVERRHVWSRLINMDGVTRAVVMGKLCYPRTCWRITPSYLPNHKSWEVPRVKEKLGCKMAA